GMDLTEPEIDARVTPVYRFLRRLVTLINRGVFRVTVEGADAVPGEGPVIIAPVHRSFIDFFFVAQVTPRKLHYMAKAELFTRPWFARFLASLGVFPVHRGSADRDALRRAQRVLDAGEVLVLFPEGERRVGPIVGSLHEGAAFLAARSDAPIVPVGIAGAVDVMPLGSKVPRPAKVRLLVGDPILPPARSPGGRIPRSQVHETTEALARSLQDLYDRTEGARDRLGRPGHDGRAQTGSAARTPE
ncbi:MAG: lysophospholipid acyltransferase family protein, partial [Acidimicrobiales bacterium]